MILNKKHPLWTGKIIILFLLFTFLFVSICRLKANNVEGILDVEKRAEVFNKWLKWRLENILPKVMQRENIEMWLIINREYNEDPVYMTMVPKPTMNARRTSILIFHNQGPSKGVEKYSGSYYPFKCWYKDIWLNKKIPQFENLARFIEKVDPKNIGINISNHWAFGDGLSAALKNKLENNLSKKYRSRLISAERLCVGWLETRSPQELSAYKHISNIAHRLIKEFFSTEVIKPGITTTNEVRWWIRQKITDLGLRTWFHPSIDIIRKKGISEEKDNNVIKRGDLLHCDVGIVYLGLCTDMQWNAYVCEIGEEDAPFGLKKALKMANKVAKIFMGEFELGRNGKEIVDKTMEKVKKEKIKALIYSHPVGFYGHAAGPSMEGRPREEVPEGTEVREEYPLFYNTLYAIEFSVYSRIPSWGNQEIRLGFEENAVFTKKGCFFVDGYQKDLILIK